MIVCFKSTSYLVTIGDEVMDKLLNRQLNQAYYYDYYG